MTDELNPLEWALLGFYVRVFAWAYRAGRFRGLLYPLALSAYWLCLLSVTITGHQGTMRRWWVEALSGEERSP